MAHQMGIEEARRYLGLGERFGEGELRRVYVSFAHEWHPDLVVARGGDAAEANAKMAMANAAQSVLADAIRSGSVAMEEESEPEPQEEPRHETPPPPPPQEEAAPRGERETQERTGASEAATPAGTPFVVMIQKFLLRVLGTMLVAWFVADLAFTVFPYGEVSPQTVFLALIQDILLLPFLALIVFVAVKVSSFLKVAAGWLVGVSENHRLFAVFADIALAIAIILVFLCLMPGGPHYTPDEALAMLGLS